MRVYNFTDQHFGNKLWVYLIEFDGKTNELINELAAKSPTSFQEIIKIYKEDDISLYEPSDYYWQTDRLWHLTSIQADLAWDITTGDPEVKIAIIDTWFDIEHPDLAEKIEPHYDPYCNTPFSADCTKNNHGTMIFAYCPSSVTTKYTPEASSGSRTCLVFSAERMKRPNES